MGSHNVFNMGYYGAIIREGQRKGYVFVTLERFVALGCPDRGHFVIRHDLDRQPQSLLPIIDVEQRLGVRSTLFVRVAGADYNLLSYPCFQAVKRAHATGSEIGLHSNPIEFATINDLDPKDVLSSEIDLLRTFFGDVVGIAPHRDINYMHNSLPWLEENWSEVSAALGLGYHAYESKILDRVTYVNEGFDPHLCWRSVTPEQAMQTGRSIYMLTHPHWWFKDHAFEAP